MCKWKKDVVKLLQKINSTRKHKGVMLPCELLGENGRQLKNCGRIVEERSSLVWNKVQMNSAKPLKSSMKVWVEFVCWLRSKNVKTMKDFKAEHEWKWLVNNISKILHVKENNNACEFHKKTSENNGQNKHEHEKEDEAIEECCEGEI